MCVGEDYNAEDQTVVIGSEGFTGSGVAPSDLGAEGGCITVNTVTDREIEGEEAMNVIGEVTTNADLAVFTESDTVPIFISDNSE